ncbi:UpxY family transcription antiterminator [Olivibacter sp. CPCC 100613]|uniref:UpxY family transcription antiterminator n=1 Tax=Olivibacter sp. CPCC 100613 TaxID=3079931 RepID=UPI002FF892E8
MKNQRQWIAIYTRPKWEKKVNQFLQQQGIAAFCPLIKTKRQWADRKKIVEIPLFSSYVFAEVNQLEQYQVEQAAGVVGVVYHCGKPATITENEINRIKTLLRENYEDLESISFDHVSPGDRIKVKAGVLSDWQGEVIMVKGKSVVMVLEQFNCALIAKVDVSQRNLLLT